MQNAEFEEKDFEASLYHQLAAGSPNLWTPGQVFEHHFGIDAALKTFNAFFLSSINHSGFPHQLILDDLDLEYVWKSYGKKRGLPSFEVNALLQAKRPQHLKGRNNNIAFAGITGEYWRFEINAHQQGLLERLCSKVGRRAVVSYACPAFHLWSELDSYISSGQLADHCSYVTPVALHGHKHWCFNSAGGRGVACSEPESVSGLPFQSLVEEVLPPSQKEIQSAEHVREQLTFLGQSIEKTVAEEADSKNGAAQAIGRRLEPLRRVNNLPPESKAFVTTAIFAEVVGCQWFVAGHAQAATSQISRAK